ncbi:MAG: class I SAM-dependent methyltransferase [Bacillota bacterium]
MTVNPRVTESVRRKYNRNALFYDSMDRMIRDEWRQRVIRQARGKALEIGVGTGQNLPFYDPAVTTELTGVDFSPGMLQRARRKPCRVPVTLLEMDAQHLAFADATFDTVLATCVFCTVPDPVLGLQEARRVCRPDGQIILLEHVRIDRPIVGPLMDLLDPLSAALIGTHINRRTAENARLAGLQVEWVENVEGDLVKLIYARP